MGKKWNQDAKPAEKLLALYTLLLSGRVASLSELSQELNCSKQAIGRLLNQLEASRFGKLLRSKRGREACYQLERPRKDPQFTLNAEGLGQLALCRDFISHLLPDGIFRNVELTLQQAASLIPEEDKRTGRDYGLLEPSGHAFVKGRIDYASFQEQFSALLQAVQNRKICEVHYQSALDQETRRFEYAPLHLLTYNNTWYIRGWIVSEKGTPRPACETSHTLALHRCKEIVLTIRSSEHLPMPPDEHPGAFGFIENVPFQAVVRFNKDVTTYVVERRWSEKQHSDIHEDGAVTVTMEVRSVDEFIAWVLTFTDKAEVISPRWLREDIAQKISKLNEYYR